MKLDTHNLPPVVRASDAARAGLSSALRGQSFVRAARGVYVPVGTDLADPDVRIAVATSRIPEAVVLGGWAAARVHERVHLDRNGSSNAFVVFDGVRADGPPGTREPILLCAPRTTRIVAGHDRRLLRSDVAEDEKLNVGGLTVTAPLRTAFDMARLLPFTDAVVALDRLRALRIVDPAALVDLLSGRARWRGVDHARRALSFSADGVESPRESMMRVLWIHAGLPVPLCNPVVVDADGRFVARVDLLDVRAGLVGEYDGGYHASASQRSADAARQERLESVGLVVVRATADDFATPPHRHVWQGRLRDVHARALGRSGSPRRWSVSSEGVPRTATSPHADRPESAGEAR